MATIVRGHSTTEGMTYRMPKKTASRPAAIGSAGNAAMGMFT